VTAPDRAAYTAGLRALADLLDQHDEIPLPYHGTGIGLSIGIHGRTSDEDTAARLATAARVLMPGTRAKAVEDDYYRVEGSLRGLKLQVWAMRDQVCERVVIGTHEVTRKVPDPVALAAVPTYVITETVEEVEWICSPITAPIAEAVSA